MAQNGGGDYSIVVDGRELNPNGIVLGNEILRDNVGKLYSALVKKLKTSDFQFKVTGGDRYGTTKEAYSSTNHSLIGKSGPAHIRGDAADLRIKWNDGTLIPTETVFPLLRFTDLIYDPGALPSHYPNDLHYHLQLPKGF